MSGIYYSDGDGAGAYGGLHRRNPNEWLSFILSGGGRGPNFYDVVGSTHKSMCLLVSK